MRKVFIFTALSLATFIAMGDTAWAGDDWIKSGTDLIDTLNSGLVKLGAGVLGIGIILYGLYSSLSGEPNWKRLGIMVFGGACVFFGPKMIVALLKAVQ